MIGPLRGARVLSRRGNDTRCAGDRGRGLTADIYMASHLSYIRPTESSSCGLSPDISGFSHHEASEKAEKAHKKADYWVC